MKPTQTLRSGGGNTPLGKYNHWIGDFGNFGAIKQKNIISYGLAPNRVNPLAHAAHDAVFNTWRRFSAQVLYIAPPLIGGYYLMNWAVERNEYFNSKAGRAEFGDAE